MSPRISSPHQTAPAPAPAAPEALLHLDEGGRLLSKAEAEALVQKIYSLAQGGGWTRIDFSNQWRGELRWARNRVRLASDRRMVQLSVGRGVRGFVGEARTNQFDDASLEAVVRAAERSALLGGAEVGLPAYMVPEPALPLVGGKIFSAASDGLAGEGRAGVAQAVIGPAEEKEMLSAGYLAVVATASLLQTNYWTERLSPEHVEFTDDGRGLARKGVPRPYTPCTSAQCSMTVRDAHGTGSGWAGLSSYDWSAIDATALGARALAKCVASRNPVALEPGRYTVILEPQAVADLLEILVQPGLRPQLSREPLEKKGLPRPLYLGYDAALGIHRTKLGLKVADERVTISHDPADPQLGILPEPGLAPVTWIKDGVLTQMGQSRDYALQELRENTPVQGAAMGYRMSGGTTTMEEMIRSTKRGLLVTRFANISTQTAAIRTLISTGLTRDGLWLIENGTITKAVKNFRFTESPMFMLNNIEQLGVPVPVYRMVDVGGGIPTPAIVPPLKVRDFSFTAMVDAV